MYRPRINIKHDGQTFFRFAGGKLTGDENDLVPLGATDGKPQKNYYYKGRFVELQQLAHTLTGKPHLSVKKACEEFGGEQKGEVVRHIGWGLDADQEEFERYIDYNRRDVRVPGALFVEMLRELSTHPTDLRPESCYSPASLGKSYQRAMRIVPPLERPRWNVSAKHLGEAASTLHGGWANVEMRNVPQPVVPLDYRSNYPSVNGLLNLWELMTADEVCVVECKAEAQATLDAITLDSCFEKATWQKLRFFAQIDPAYDVLPVRGKFWRSHAEQIAFATVVSSEKSLWWAGPDLANSCILSGHAPQVLSAWKFEPTRNKNGQIRKLRGLRPTKVGGLIDVDPRADDFYLKLVEQRERVRTDLSIPETIRERIQTNLKIINNSTSYGTNIEMNVDNLGAKKKERVTVHGTFGKFETTTKMPEDPGEFCFPPFAALITAGAHLLLGMIERCVKDLRGSIAARDTDSAFPIATEHGGLVPCPNGQVFG